MCPAGTETGGRGLSREVTPKLSPEQSTHFGGQNVPAGAEVRAQALRVFKASGAFRLQQGRPGLEPGEGTERRKKRLEEQGQQCGDAGGREPALPSPPAVHDWAPSEPSSLGCRWAVGSRMHRAPAAPPTTQEEAGPECPWGALKLFRGSGHTADQSMSTLRSGPRPHGDSDFRPG